MSNAPSQSKASRSYSSLYVTASFSCIQHVDSVRGALCPAHVESIAIGRWLVGSTYRTECLPPAWQFFPSLRDLPAGYA